jgi:uncharacterized membrane protein (UPF0127 family)
MYKIFTCLSFCFLSGCVDYSQVESTLPICSKKKTTLSFNDAVLNAKIACSNTDKQKGLMTINHLPENQGMIFVFAKEDYLNFWMKDTQIPLSIAFIDASYKIVDIKEMKAFDQTNVKSTYPALYAVEANANWFKLYNVNIGDYMKLKE